VAILQAIASPQQPNEFSNPLVNKNWQQQPAGFANQMPACSSQQPQEQQMAAGAFGQQQSQPTKKVC